MKRKAAVVLSIVVMLTVFVAYTWALPQVLDVGGEPKILKKGTDVWVRCAQKMTVDSGDRIITSEGEYVEITSIYMKKNVIKIGPGSEAVCFFEKSPLFIELSKGEITAFMANLPKGSSFEVRTPAGISGAKNTGWMSQTDGKISTFTSFANTIYVKGVNPDGSIMQEELLIDRGYLTIVEKYETPKRILRASQSAIARWNDWREKISRRDLGLPQEK